MTDCQWNICRENGQILSGGYSTRDDAILARRWIERVYEPETFWVLDDRGVAARLRLARSADR